MWIVAVEVWRWRDRAWLANASRFISTKKRLPLIKRLHQHGLDARPKASLLGTSVAIWSFRWRIRSEIWRGTWRSREVGDSCISFWTPFHENLIQCLQKIFLDIIKIEPWKGPKQSITFYKFEGKIQNFHTLSVPSQFERIILYLFFNHSTFYKKDITISTIYQKLT